MIINKQYLIDFEKEVIEKFKKGETYGPVHLSGGNEDDLLKIFKNIKPQDWVFSTHRSHYHALLKSKDRDWLMDEIIVNANSSHINSAKHKIFTSAIVGGNIPIALGVAMGIKLRNDNLKNHLENIKGKNFKVTNVKITKQQQVWCFVGDMASRMGQFMEAVEYADGFDLPITFIIENNGLGCNTPTHKSWSNKGYCFYKISNKVIKYDYKRTYPHYGIGEWVTMSNELKTKGDYVAEEVK